MWQPPLPNNGKVRVTIMVGDTETAYYLDHYHTLNIEPFIEYNGNKNYLVGMLVNDEETLCTPKLYLNKDINTVELYYYEFAPEEIGFVLESLDDVSLTNYLPQIGALFFEFSFPRGSVYQAAKIGQDIVYASPFAFPVDLDKEDFDVWFSGMKFTLHLNRDKKVDVDGAIYIFLEIIKAEFYGELLPTEHIDDYVELKPKGV